MQLEDIEVKVLAEAIFLYHGYDFRDYAEASFKRRLKALMRKAQLTSLSQLQHLLLHDPDFFASAVAQLTIAVSEMFRDPGFFRSLREHVFPVLRTYPAFKIWHAGCSSGEEVYSLAIALKEEGLYDRAVIYATDLNAAALKVAKDGIYPMDSIRAFTANYQDAGGRRAAADYYTACYGAARLDPALAENVVFAEHNLATDDVFSEMNLILCRNVMIYFKRELQDRVLELFTRSLAYKGFLCLGSKETVRFMKGSEAFEPVVAQDAIFRKLGPRQFPWAEPPREV